MQSEVTQNLLDVSLSYNAGRAVGVGYWCRHTDCGYHQWVWYGFGKHTVSEDVSVDTDRCDAKRDR